MAVQMDQLTLRAPPQEPPRQTEPSVRPGSDPTPLRAAGPAHRGRGAALAILATADAGAIATAWVVAGAPALGGAVFVVALAVALAATGGYRLRVCLQAVDDALSQLGRVSGAVVVTGLLTGGASMQLLALGTITAVLLVAGRAAAYAAIRTARRRRVVAERTIILGSGAVAAAIGRQLRERPEHGLELVGFVEDEPLHELPAPVLGGWSDLERLLDTHRVARVVLAFSPMPERQLVPVARRLAHVDVDVDVVPRFFEVGFDAGARDLDSVSCIPLQRIQRAGTRRTSWRAKRAFDIAASSVGLFALLPVLLTLAVAVRLTSAGPVLFRQERVGQHGRTFDLLKFRTLRVNDDSATCWSVVGDDRQTTVGRWMRRLSLDELPQLWNVLLGDMSLIGPRPERPFFVERFAAEVPNYDARHRFPVGLTGLAQVNGLRGDTSIAERARYDNHYIDQWSLRRDLSILGATVAAVVRDARAKRSA